MIKMTCKSCSEQIRRDIQYFLNEQKRLQEIFEKRLNRMLNEVKEKK